MRTVLGAVLAAGAGVRMGAPKATLTLDGVSLLDRSVTTLLEGGCSDVIAIVRDGVDTSITRSVVNRQPDTGMRGSLQLAVQVALAENASALAVMPVDMPGISPQIVKEVLAAYRPGRIALPSFHGVWGHPVVMDPPMWGEALRASGPDEGARRFLRWHVDLVDAVVVAGDPSDLDTPGDLRRWRRRVRRTAE